MLRTTTVHEFETKLGLTWDLNMHQEKKIVHGNFLIFVHKNVYRIRFQKIKIGPLKGYMASETTFDHRKVVFS